ncbi:unnamed protein product [Orchesella dallaii]|uniref:Uncharacterized protein n=1 Tax=Orchesella dallaii TaxID=48710 RepID=A0ABP1S7R8_9HEXA
MDFQKLEQELFPFSKIIEVGQDGQLNLIPENLNRILTYWHKYISVSAPSRFLAVTGGSKNGKTLVTNFVIQSLINLRGVENEGGLRGFSWDSSSLQFPSLVHCDDKDKAGEGAVYLWPTPFLSTGNVSGGAEEKSFLWIFHIDGGSNAANEITLRPLEQFLLLVCSHLVEIIYSANKFQLVSSTETLLKEGVELEQLCQSFTYLVRAPEGNPLYSQFPTLNPTKETTKVLEILLQKSELRKLPENRVKFLNESTNDFENATLLKFPNYSGSIYGNDGFLCQDAIKELLPYVEIIVQDVTSRAAKTPSKMVMIGGVFQPLTGENMMEFFRLAVNKVNCINPVMMEVENEEEENFQKPEQQQNLSQNHHLAENSMKFCQDSTPKQQEELKPFLFLLENLILAKIESSLKFSNVSCLFQDCFQQASISPHADAPIPQELMEKYRLEIEKLSSIAKGFTNEIRRYFANNCVCFRNNKVLENFCKKECNEFLKAYGATTTHSNSLPLEKLGSKACEKLGQIFHEENAKIVSNEEEMGNKVVGKLLEFYKREMMRFRTEIGFEILNYTSKEQEEHHRKLEKECISLLRECMNLNGKLNEVLPMKEGELKKNIACAFEEHSNFIQREQVNAQQALKPSSSLPSSSSKNSGGKFQNKAINSQVVSRPLPSSSQGRPVTLGPVKIHPQNRFIDVTLIFQLTLDDLTMGCILKNDANDGIPRLIATELTLIEKIGQHQYLVGNDVDIKPGAIIWSLRNILMNDNHQNQQHKNTKASQNCANNTSYLIGMLLKKLRRVAESQLGHKFSRAIVTFPYHMQRSCHNFSQNILAGAQTYGEFENVQVVEENECLAEAFLNSVDKSQCKNRGILVLSQNCEFVDVLRHYFDGELKVTKREGEIVDQSEKRCFGILRNNKVSIELKNVHSIHKQDNLIAAAVVGSGSLTPDIYVEMLVNYFPLVYFFEDSKLALIIGAVLADHDAPENKNAKILGDKREQINMVPSKRFDDGVVQKLHKNAISVPISQVGTSTQKQEKVSQSVSSTSEQKKEEVEISQELLERKQHLLKMCNEIQSRIESVQFQSELAKKVLLKKVTEARKLAMEKRSSDNNDGIRLIKIQIDLLQDLAIRHKLFGNE